MVLFHLEMVLFHLETNSTPMGTKWTSSFQITWHLFAHLEPISTPIGMKCDTPLQMKYGYNQFNISFVQMENAISNQMLFFPFLSDFDTNLNQMGPTISDQMGLFHLVTDWTLIGIKWTIPFQIKWNLCPCGNHFDSNSDQMGHTISDQMGLFHLTPIRIKWKTPFEIKWILFSIRKPFQYQLGSNGKHHFRPIGKFTIGNHFKWSWKPLEAISNHLTHLKPLDKS